MTKEIPKFIYHGTIKRNYENMQLGGGHIVGDLQCTPRVDEGIGFSQKRARQWNDEPILIVIESGKHNVRGGEGGKYLISENLNPEGHISIPICPYSDEGRFVRQYYFLRNLENSASAERLEDFLEVESNDK